jgi:hypothetical protein
MTIETTNDLIVQSVDAAADRGGWQVVYSYIVNNERFQNTLC